MQYRQLSLSNFNSMTFHSYSNIGQFKVSQRLIMRRSFVMVCFTDWIKILRFAQAIEQEGLICNSK